MSDFPNSTPTKANSGSEQVEGRRELTRALVLCVSAVLFVRSFLFEPFKIPSSSMMPTLRIGDHIFVSKFNYGFSIPFTKIEFAAWGQPKRGDVIVFLFPRDESLHYIKRVVAVPGDRVEFQGRDILINGEPLKREQVEDNAIKQALEGVPTRGELFKEKIGDVVHYVKYSRGAPSFDYSRITSVEVVPENKFFVVGDNRDDSYDSRSWGYVPRENIKGKAQMVWLSLDQEQPWGLKKIRWSRCGTLIY